MSAGHWWIYCRAGHLVHEEGEGTSDFFGDQAPDTCPFCGSKEFAGINEDADAEDFPVHIDTVYKLEPLHEPIFDEQGNLFSLPFKPYRKVGIQVFEVKKLFEGRGT